MANGRCWNPCRESTIFLVGNDELPYKFQPGNVNFELTYGLLGITDYFLAVYEKLIGSSKTSMRDSMRYLFSRFAEHEEKLATILIDFLKTKSRVRIIGTATADMKIRVPTISFVVDGWNSRDITLKADVHDIGIRYGDFYARRLIESLNLVEQGGVVRVSMVHYNTPDEVKRLVDVLEDLLK